jgi:hypothetical protein
MFIRACFAICAVPAFQRPSERAGEALVRISSLIVALIVSAAVNSAHARDVALTFSIAEALADAELRNKVGSDVAFFFGDQVSPPVAKTFGDFVTNKKTNAFGKPDMVACRWAMESALIQLRDRARSLGANAVINIVSYYDKNITPSTTEYVCHAGNVVAGVALKGTFVVLGSGAAPAGRPAGRPAPVQQPAAQDVASRLKKLQDLKDKGLIDQSEYDKQREKFLAGI